MLTGPFQELLALFGLRGATCDDDSQKQTYQEQQLTKYYNIPDFDVFYEKYDMREKEYSTQALVFLLNFCAGTSPFIYSIIS